LKTIPLISHIGRQAFNVLLAFLLLAITGNEGWAQDTTETLKPRKNFTTRVWLGAHLLPGSGQVVNKQYWKLPIFYAGMGSMVYMGIHSNQTYLSKLSAYNSLADDDPNKEIYKEQMVKRRRARNAYVAAAGVAYIASVADAVLVYNNEKHSPVAATILSTLVPGMGQAYNQKYWKIPVIYGGLSTFYFMISWNNRGYKRFKKALLYVMDDDPTTIDEFNGARSEDNLRYYMDSYRRNRDLCILGVTAVYVLNILDANVDGFLYDWNVDDNLSFRVEPSVLNSSLASQSYSTPAFGLTCRVTF